MTLGERVQLGEAAFVEPPTKTDARDAQHEAGPTGPEVVAPALTEARAQRVGQSYRMVVDGAHDEVGRKRTVLLFETKKVSWTVGAVGVGRRRV